jgi:hypothetical protein
MRTRLKLAAIALALSGVSIGLWSALAYRQSALDPIDCNIQAPLPLCAKEQQAGMAAHGMGNGMGISEPELASAPVNDGTLARIRFAPKAAAADITEFLIANSISVVDGPKGGGMYTVRLPETGKKKTDLIKRIAIETAIVEFIATAQ